MLSQVIVDTLYTCMRAARLRVTCELKARFVSTVETTDPLS